MTITRLVALALAVLVWGRPGPAAAQFDPFHNHLKCYQIKEKPIVRRVVLDNQFGREIVAKLIPQLLCVPTAKYCCAPTTSPKDPCLPVSCPPDPTPYQPAAVDHFKCYKIAAKLCKDAADPACAQTALAKKDAIQVALDDQFSSTTTFVGTPRFLCVPVRKTVLQPATTSTTTTTLPSNACTCGTPCEVTCADGTVDTGTCVLQSGGNCFCEAPCSGSAQCATTCNDHLCYLTCPNGQSVPGKCIIQLNANVCLCQQGVPCP